MRNFFGKNGIVWFIGVVEDRTDPVRLGRVRVRAFGWHTDDKNQIPTDALPWAVPVNGINYASVNGIAQSPTGMVEGSWVVGFFMDGERAQEPFVLGTIGTIPTEGPDPSKGFFDPAGIYPKSDFLNEPDTNRLCAADPEHVHKIHAEKEAARTKGVPLANGKGSWDEPAYAWNAIYPFNHVRETETGHIEEYDDTEGAERIHEYHRTGTFYEIDQDGNKVTRVVGNEYEVVFKDKDINIKGNCNLTVDANCTTYIKGNWDIQVDGNVNEVVRGNVTETVRGRKDTTVSGEITRTSRTHIDDNAPRIDLN